MAWSAEHIDSGVEAAEPADDAEAADDAEPADAAAAEDLSGVAEGYQGLDSDPDLMEGCNI